MPATLNGLENFLSYVGLDMAGVELTEHGYVKVNERLETTDPGV